MQSVSILLISVDVSQRCSQSYPWSASFPEPFKKKAMGTRLIVGWSFLFPFVLRIIFSDINDNSQASTNTKNWTTSTRI